MKCRKCGTEMVRLVNGWGCPDCGDFVIDGVEEEDSDEQGEF